MGAEIVREDLSEALVQQRLLTEVDHLLAARQDDRQYDPSTLQDVKTNLHTATEEAAMPYAVSVTYHKAVETLDEEGRRKRLFMWLGKCAVTVAESGRRYHFSEAGLKRVGVEVAEADDSQKNLRAGHAKVFLSPKMSPMDAPKHVAKKEHVGDEDSIRVSYLVTDSQGRAVARRLESLLVRDIALESWVAMLKDPNNIFGKAFELKNETSALSVMELFEELELPEDEVTEGPVTLVQAVVPYINDEAARQSAERQLRKFREDQGAYRSRAEETAQEWLEFEVELAESLHHGWATYEIQRFIAILQHEWGERELETILNHQQLDGDYVMTRELAAVLEKAKQNLLHSSAAIATGNEKVLAQMDDQTAQEIRAHITYIKTMEASGFSPDEIARERAELDRKLADQSLTVGGGCPGENTGSFKDKEGAPGQGTTNSAESNKNNWTWKKGVCRVKSCKSPQPTEVGPCSVCRRCQHAFDSGRDPTKAPAKKVSKQEDPMDKLFAEIRRTSQNSKEQAAAKRQTQRVGELALIGAG